MELRWSYGGASKEFGGFSLFSSNPCCPPARRAIPRFFILHSFSCHYRHCRSQKVAPLTAQIPPSAAPEPGIHSASQSGANVPDQPGFFGIDRVEPKGVIFWYERVWVPDSRASMYERVVC